MTGGLASWLSTVIRFWWKREGRAFREDEVAARRYEIPRDKIKGNLPCLAPEKEIKNLLGPGVASKGRKERIIE